MQEQVESSLFETDTLLADEFLETTRRKFYLEPEKDLMLSVLEDALHCFQSNLFPQTKKEMVLFKEAEEWILQKNSHWLFSFENICECLNIDPNYLREGLIDWRRTTVKNRAKLKKGVRQVLTPKAKNFQVNQFSPKTSIPDEEKVFTDHRLRA